MSFAVIKTGGKQYRVEPGQKLRIEKCEAEKGGEISFDEVLLIVDGDKVEIGMPRIRNAKVEAEVLEQGREKKKIVFKYHAKSRYRKLKGHRQPFTEVMIKKIVC
ncbi:MAG: 50S ribosomal protein L21 [bacterium]|nr:50S ribosomal protein L21 [bacterium]